MRTLVKQVSDLVTLADATVATIQSPVIRSPIQGVEGLEEAARKAILVDDAVLTFTLRNYADLVGCSVILTMHRFALLGGWEEAQFVVAFPDPTIDVTGAIFLNRGVVQINAEEEGIWSAQLAITNNSGGVLNFAYQVTVHGRVPDETLGRESI